MANQHHHTNSARTKEYKRVKRGIIENRKISISGGSG
jgi:hypothetical protein